MLPPVHRGNGTNIATPDVCNTPVAVGTSPIPYVNTADCAQSTGFSTMVMITNQNACHLSTQIPSTTGDEAGTAHYSFKGNALWTAGNAVVMIENKPAVTLSSPTSQNKGNAVGATVVPSVSTVLFTRRPPDTVVPVPRDEPPFVGDRALLHVRVPALELSTPGRLGLRLKRERPRGLSLDLRGNPGGRFDVLVRLAEMFFARDTPLVRLARGGTAWAWVARRTPVFANGPVAIIVDDRTASAAELFAAVLQHHGRARVFGPGPTWGKSRALRLDGATPAFEGRVLLPDGTDIESAGGVHPDVRVPSAHAVATARRWLAHATADPATPDPHAPHGAEERS
ncbi:MAG: PAAR-like domain-containing protein [Myxococcota bacterium]